MQVGATPALGQGMEMKRRPRQSRQQRSCAADALIHGNQQEVHVSGTLELLRYLWDPPPEELTGATRRLHAPACNSGIALSVSSTSYLLKCITRRASFEVHVICLLWI